MQSRPRLIFKMPAVLPLFLLLSFYNSGCGKSNCGTTAIPSFNNADKQFMDRETVYNRDELAAAALASANADSAVRPFARHRLAASDSAQAMLNRAAVSYSVFLPQTAGSVFYTFQERWSSGSGTGFDTAYLDFEIPGQRGESVRLQQEIAHGQDSLLLNYCKRQLVVSNSDLNQAKSLLAFCSNGFLD